MEPHERFEWVDVAVPRRFLGEVYQLLGELMARGDAVIAPFTGRGAASVERSVRVDDDNGEWTRSMVERLRRDLSSDMARAALDRIAQDAPKSISYLELLEDLNVSPNALKAELAALSRTTRRLFSRKTWPMTATPSSVPGGSMSYVMPREIADWWLGREDAEDAEGA